MPPKKPDPKAAKGAAAPKPSGVKPKGPPPATLPTEPPLVFEKIVPQPYDARIHEPPICMNSFTDFPGRRPQLRPTDPAMTRPGGGTAGAGGGGKADPKAKGKADPKAAPKKKK